MSGWQKIAGGVWSTTVTVKVHSDLLPEASVAWQFTVVCPGGKVPPDGGSQDSLGAGSHLSVAVVVKVTVAPFGDVHSAMMGFGQASSGGVVSFTMTKKEHSIMLPAWSFAVQTTSV